jgi:DNA-binding response OmpR family regulator
MSDKILIVDDDQSFAQSLAMLLEMRGYEVDVAHSGDEAIALFTVTSYAIAFMDVRMPGKNGVESFFAIRDIHPDAQIMMMTAYTVEQLLDQAIDNGALGVLAKPLDIDAVVSAIEGASPEGIVLVADKDPNFIESIRTVLADKNYSVLVATSGQEAIDKVLNSPVNLLILDLKLPVLSGLEVYLTLKKHNRALPTVIVSDSSLEADPDLSPIGDTAVTGFLRKPFDSQELTECIDALLKEKPRND